MPNSLTARQEQVLAYIRQCLNRTGIAPTLREIAASLGVPNHNGMLRHLRVLEQRGWIRLREGEHRGIQLLDDNDSALIPIYGKVAAGKPIEAAEHVLKSIPAPVGLFQRDPDYFLRVEGDSMIDALIFDGDLAAVRRAESADSGQIVVAHINTDEMSRAEKERCGINSNGLTLKKLGLSGQRVLLKSMNRAKSYTPFSLDPESVRIEGIFLGTVRGN